MSNRMYFPMRGSLNRETVQLYGQLTTSTNGTVASQTSKGFSAARTGTGTYTITLQDTYGALLHCFATVRIATITPGKGQVASVSSVDLANKTIVVKVYRPDTQVVADVDDGAVIAVTLILSRVPLS